MAGAEVIGIQDIRDLILFNNSLRILTHDTWNTAVLYQAPQSKLHAMQNTIEMRIVHSSITASVDTS